MVRANAGWNNAAPTNYGWSWRPWALRLPTYGLKLWWDFSHLAGSETAATDLSGNGKTGTIENGVAAGAFDGANDYVWIATGDSDLVFGTNDYALHVWLQYAADVMADVPISKGAGNAPAPNDGQWQATILADETIRYLADDSGISITTAGTHHGAKLLLSIFSAGGTHYVYKNRGTALGSDATAVNLDSDTRTFMVGARDTGAPGAHFVGTIWRVVVYKLETATTLAKMLTRVKQVYAFGSG